VNRQHLQTILWLRWRLSLNRWKRSGRINAILMVVIVVLALISSVLAFIGSFYFGATFLRRAEPDHLLLIWDAVVAAFLLFWMIGIVAELQRSESLSLDKLLHLPISLSGAFLLNYLSSLVSLSLIIFLPLMAGLTIAMVVVSGPTMLLLFPLVASFMLMITGITYQFRGWLATLMVNKRRRRTIITLVTFGFILLVQIPNMLNMMVIQQRRDPVRETFVDELLQLQADLKSGKVDHPEFEQRLAKRQQLEERRKQQNQNRFQQTIDTAIVVNLALPIGWLPYGARTLAMGNVLPGILGSIGAALIGAASLWRAHRTTLRLYTGDYQARGPRTRPKATEEVTTVEPKTTRHPSFLEKEFGWVSQQAAVVALASFRSLMRAPEAKMMLLSPVIMLVVFGSMLLSGQRQDTPELLRPLMALGAISMTMVGLLQLMQNQFGFDRSGFRAYVLAPTQRSDILLGKNLSVAPLAFGMCLISLTLFQLLLPMKIDHLLATLVQVISVYVIFCMVGNLASIIAPIPIKAGSLKAAKPSGIAMLIQFASFFLFLLALIPPLLPLGLDLLVDYLGWRSGVPVYLILSIVELGALLWIYKHVLVAQGRLFQRREQKILATVTARAD